LKIDVTSSEVQVFINYNMKTTTKKKASFFDYSNTCNNGPGVWWDLAKRKGGEVR
jgi:hypothetical protein